MVDTSSSIELSFQTLAGLYVINKLSPIVGLTCGIICIYMLFTPYYYVSMMYFAFMYSDRHTPNRGGRPCNWLRNSPFVKYFTDYFPMKLIKTQDLDPGQNYMFICHPHGLMSLSFVGHFALQRTGFATIFEGLNSRFAAIDALFRLPLHREVAMLLGFISVSKRSIEWCLRGKEGTGQVVAFSVGGSREVLDAIPNTMNLYLKNRKGFVKIALTTGTSLVPVLSFGENEIFEQKVFEPNSRFRRYQEWLLKTFGFTQPVPTTYLPIRHPINTIVGMAIPVTKIANPSAKQINELHDRYIDIQAIMGNFFYQRSGFLTMFKGLELRVVTLGVHFWIPFHRDMMLMGGLINSTQQSIEWCLRGCRGQAVVIVVGGGRESLEAIPNTMILYLKNRKGFARIALTTGTSLVPVLSFGENEVYEQIVFPPSSRFRRYQEWLLKKFAFTQPVTTSLLPFRRPITTIVGKPIPVAKVDNPSAEQINELHDRYIDILPTHDQFKQISHEFEHRFDYPMAVGCIDAIHFPIQTPKEQAHYFCNYKGWYSVVALAVSDANSKVYYVNAGIPGDCSDSGAFSQTDIFKQCDKFTLFPKSSRRFNNNTLVNYHLLGDSAFQLKPWLIKPYLYEYNMPRDQVHFNKHHDKARSVIHTAFDRVKARWRRLSTPMDFKLEQISDVIIVAFAMNNLCDENKCRIDPKWIRDLQTDRVYSQPLFRNNDRNADQFSIEARDALKQYFHTSH
ncbi:unnamed protein product [Medioppia subpectinata]|uniref:DDE Tnp4 domain-containing protein n=1 Tax=Medioppia subpectinata TaxID=1979941 RepID=A0A7R9KH10_9ACAR|nr:unnamed protein product [Medioppia subpectinata]CAG2103195.1 unnamed protein product [Medioppia subpectinata]